MKIMLRTPYENDAENHFMKMKLRTLYEDDAENPL